MLGRCWGGAGEVVVGGAEAGVREVIGRWQVVRSELVSVEPEETETMMIWQRDR